MKTLSKIFLAICLAVVANSYAQDKIVTPPDEDVNLGIPLPSEEPPIDIPFAVAEEKPMFEACKEVPNDRQTECFKKQLDNYVKIHLKYPPKSLAARIEGRAVIVFRINTDGTVTIIGKRGTDEILEEEAVFLINSLPCLIPGKMKGVPTAVTFAYPINFKLPR
nr:TonB family protein [uncultured Capnocytophaga sp.]